MVTLESVVIAVLGAVLGVVLGIGFGVAMMYAVRDEGLEGHQPSPGGSSRSSWCSPS